MESTDFIYGNHSVLEALDAGRAIEKIFVKNARGEVAARARAAGIPVKVVPEERLNRFTRKNHQGVVALMSAIEYSRLDTLLPGLFEEGILPFILVLDGLTDVRNFGAIARTAECCGVNAIVIPERGSVSVGADAVRASSGALNHIPVCREASLSRAMKFIQQCGCTIVCSTEKSDRNYTEGDYTVPLALVMGAEDTGISAEILRIADVRAAIPMFGHIGSLNVGVAAGVMMYEVVRQRLQANVEII